MIATGVTIRVDTAEKKNTIYGLLSPISPSFLTHPYAAPAMTPPKKPIKAGMNAAFAKLGFIGSDFLQSKQRIVIFLSFVVGAVISPTPDIFTQSMIAIPLILLYELSYLVVRFVLRR